ncbi:hypothetical protein LEP1GSC170_5620 [Leptospira interrogans serovar Bataviae str. HAI135]|nr:hypothetical protein LEP1GSC170_5620 [Leptospira interrogans serovar Bataviae str. HAI135]
MILQFFKHSFFLIQFAVVPTDLDSFCYFKIFRPPKFIFNVSSV